MNTLDNYNLWRVQALTAWKRSKLGKNIDTIAKSPKSYINFNKWSRSTTHLSLASTTQKKGKTKQNKIDILESNIGKIKSPDGR